jgi:hypothetical protein
LHVRLKPAVVKKRSVARWPIAKHVGDKTKPVNSGAVAVEDNLAFVRPHVTAASCQCFTEEIKKRPRERRKRRKERSNSPRATNSRICLSSYYFFCGFCWPGQQIKFIFEFNAKTSSTVIRNLSACAHRASCAAYLSWSAILLLLLLLLLSAPTARSSSRSHYYLVGQLFPMLQMSPVMSERPQSVRVDRLL